MVIFLVVFTCHSGRVASPLLAAIAGYGKKPIPLLMCWPQLNNTKENTKDLVFSRERIITRCSRALPAGLKCLFGASSHVQRLPLWHWVHTDAHVWVLSSQGHETCSA